MIDATTMVLIGAAFQFAQPVSVIARNLRQPRQQSRTPSPDVLPRLPFSVPSADPELDRLVQRAERVLPART